MKKMKNSSDINFIYDTLVKLKKDLHDESVQQSDLAKEKYNETLLGLESRFASLDNKISELMKYSILQNWKIYDSIEAICKNSEDLIKCKICDFEGARGSFQTLISNCIFNGGVLERYLCPECGTIFGPLKMLKLSENEMNQEYRIHYNVYNEGDSTDKEIRAFHSLNPTKDGVYLNYGCGAWSKTIDILREEGYDISGYDPYASTDNPNILSNIQELKRRRFDGIITNNLIEHLFDPLDTFRFLNSLLKDSHSLIAHATPCYEYKYEFTRFHLFFYTGKSIDIISKKCNMIIKNIDKDDNIDFINYVFGIREKEYITEMKVMNNGSINNDGVIINKNGIIYGPYVNLRKGNYTLDMDCQFDNIEKEWIELKITKNSGELIHQYMIHNGTNRIMFSIEEFSQNVEYVITNTDLDYFSIKTIKLINLS